MVEDTAEEGVMDSIWTLAFSVIMIISICGNTIVLWIVLGINFMLDRYLLYLCYGLSSNSSLSLIGFRL